MAESNGEIRFWTEELFSGNTGVIDGCTIRGVSVITGGQEAEGHGLTIDDTTLRQLQECAKERGKIPVTLDHGSGIKDINGFLTGFRLDSSGGKPKIRADWHLLETHPETRVMLEKAEKMPTCFGLSVAFKGPPKGVAIGGGKMAARCEKLLSVDVVTRPAANEGLFSVPSVDKLGNNMAKKEVKLAEGDQGPPDPDAEQQPTMADIMQALQQLNGRLDQHEQFLGQLQDTGEEDQGPTLEQLAQASDEELAQIGVTRAEVDAAVQEVLAGMEAEGQQSQGEGPQHTGEGEMVGAGAGTEAAPSFGGGEAPATFRALQNKVVQLENNQKLIQLRKKQEAEEIELKSIEEKVMILAKQRDEAITFAETIAAENEALRLAVKTGTRPVKAGGGDDGVRMFGANDNGELHEFQLRVKQLVDGGKSEGQAIQLAVKENPGRHADYVASLANKKVA